jgi:hypothetical protein
MLGTSSKANPPRRQKKSRVFLGFCGEKLKVPTATVCRNGHEIWRSQCSFGGKNDIRRPGLTPEAIVAAVGGAVAAEPMFLLGEWRYYRIKNSDQAKNQKCLDRVE